MVDRVSVESAASRWALVVVFAIALLVFAIVWTWLRSSPTVEPTNSARPSPASPSFKPMPPSAAPVATNAAPKPPPRAAAGGIEVCGGVAIAETGDAAADDAAVQRALEAPTAALRTTVVARLRERGDARSRAAAEFFQNARDAFLDQIPCGDAEECAQRAEATARSRTRRDALARVAVESSDPQVYAWAVQTCTGATAADPGACSLVSAAQWARIDPENGAAWQAVAEEARGRNDAAALDEAMYRLGFARRVDSGWFALTGLVLDAVPSESKRTAAAMQLAVEAIGIEAALPFAGLQTISTYCTPASLADANRRQVCDRVANALVERSGTLLELSVGLGLAKRLGWSSERLERVADERDAFGEMLATADSQTAEARPHGCDAVIGALNRFRDTAALGELGHARALVQASGSGVRELAARARAAHAAAAAAYAASAAASAASR